MRTVVRSSALLLTLALTACPSGKPGDTPADPHALRVLSVTPEGTTETRPIEILFSGPVVEEGRVGQEATGVITVTPAIPGRAVWSARDRVTLMPSEPFPIARKFAVKLVLPTAPGGGKIVGPEGFVFNTQLLALRGVELFYAGVGTADVRANLNFNHAVQPEAAARAVTFVLGDGKVLTPTLETTKPGETMAFRLPPIELAPDQESIPLKVTIKAELVAAAGGEPLGADAVRELAVNRPSALVVDQIYPQQRGKEYVLSVRFNDAVDVDAAQAALSVTPAVKLVVREGYRGVELEGPFKSGQTYQVTVKKGLVGRAGGALVEDLTRAVTIADLDPQLRFTHDGNYLTRSGNQRVGLESVNVDKVNITVDKVFENNLTHVLPRLRSASRSCSDGGCYDEYGYDYYSENYYSSYYDLSSYGANVYAASLELGGSKNEWRDTVIPFDQLDTDQRFGLYRLRISDSERGWQYVEKWLLSTDLGLTAKVGREEARVTVVSLSTLQPVPGVKVRFHSSTNQLIGEVVSDAQGVATLSLALAKPAEPLNLITAQKDKDFSYLALASTAIPTADFDVGGDGDTTSPYEGYVYLDRGVYRPGDTARLSVLVRDKSLKTPPVFPYTIEVRDPQWRVFATLRGTTGNDGAATFDVPFANDALTGNYAVRVFAASDTSVIGHETIKVEEFMPDRIKVDVKPRAAAGEWGEAIGFDVQSNYLFGPPAKGLRIESTCDYREVGLSSEYASTFSFGDVEGRTRLGSEEPLGESTLDDEGKLGLECPANGTAGVQLPVRVTLLATVSENGGRAVTGVASTLVHPLPYYLGVRRNSTSYYAELGKPSGVEALVVGRDGKPQAGVAVQATFYSIDYKTVLKLVNGRYSYVSERSEKKLDQRLVTSAGGPVPVDFKASKVGSYRVSLESQGAATSVEYWVGGEGYGAWDMKNPSKIALTLDRADYAAGETAKVMVRAPFAGQLILTVERDKVLWQTTQAMSGNTTTVDVPVSFAMSPNAYVVAQVVRGPKSAEKLAPMRAFGVVPLAVKADRHKLAVKVTAPETMRPSQPLEVSLETTGGQGAVQVTLAVVDEGILRITGFDTPDPFKFFTRKRRLGITTYDLFDALLPEVDGRTATLIRTQGGDAARGKHLNPVSVKRVKPVALWSGLVKLDSSGKGKVKLDVPQFQGSLRVMAVAFEGDKFGSGQANVTVRDPIVLTPTLPRFVGPLDKFLMPVEVFNGTGAAAKVEVEVAIEGRIQVAGEKKRVIDIAAGAQEMVVFPLVADEVAGKAKVTVHARAGSDKTWSETELAIRPPATVSTEGVAQVVRAATPLKVKVPSGYLPGTLKVSVTAGPAPVAQFGAALQYLIQYPYGCLEQTTSRVFPLVYLKDLAKTAAPELASDTAIDQYVNAGIGRVQNMAVSSGGLSYWPGSGWGYAWTTIYATHFLVEAKKAGYLVDELLLKRLLEHLAGVSNAVVFPVYGAAADFRTQAYALYVLSLAGRPNTGAMAYAGDVLKRALDGKPIKGVPVSTDEETRAFLAGAMMLAGDKARGSELAAQDFSLAKAGRGSDSFWSSTRADAVLLGVLAEVNPDHRSVPALMKALIDKAKLGYWYNTQENAYALLALGKIGRAMGTGEYAGNISVNGKSLRAFDSKASAGVQGDEAWVGQELEVSVTGAGAAFVGVRFEGIKAGLEPAVSNKGLTVERTFLDKGGRELDPSSIRQGDLVYVRLRVGGPARVDNLALVDLLPAGLEIENPRLGAAEVQDWMKDRHVADYVDIRDDRILLFLRNSSGSTQSYYYSARAVTEGEFVLPHAHVEAMYDPETQGRAGAGRLVVKGRDQ
jgi:uncharacterized protein YfaS (alpha-2-macroglobulin family)